MDTAEVKILEARLDEVLRRLDEFIALNRDQTKDIEKRVRAIEERQSRFMGQIALAAIIGGPVLAVIAQGIVSKL